MKKLLLVFTVCAFLAACSDGTSNTDVTTDTTSTTVTTDSAALAPATTDSTNKMSADSTHTMSADSTHK